MDVKEILKWAVIIIVGWFALQWLLGFLGNQSVNLGGALYTGYASGGVINAPATPVYGWGPPWTFNYAPRGRRGRR